MSKNQIKLLLFLLLAASTFGFAYWMYDLNQQEKLWGHLPLAFTLSAWGLIMILWDKRFSKHPEQYKLLGWASLSSVILSLGFPTIPLTFLMFIGFVPLLWVEHRLSEMREEPVKWEVFKYSYHSFILWNIFTTYWVVNTSFAPGMVAITANSLLMSIPFVLFHQTKKILNNKMAWLSFLAYWMAFEYLHLRWEISWPWLTLGNSFAQFPSWVQWYEFTGVFGGSLWILLANVFFFQLWEKYQNTKKLVVGQWIKPLALILVPIGISLVLYSQYEDRGTKAEMVVVQPNFEPHYVKFSTRERDIVQQFVQLSESQLTENTEYLVFPETSFFGVRIEDMLGSSLALQELKRMVDQYPRLKLVTGISARKFYAKGEEHSPAVRTFVRKTDTIYWESYNAAVQLTSGDQDMPLYFKSILVPGAEFTPYRNILFFIQPIVQQLGGTFSGLGKQEERTAFQSEEGYGVAPVICYESIYGEYVTGYIRKGANALFIITNDGWWDNTAGHRQHLLFASLRAIETRRSIARSANTGSSAFINQRGDVFQATDYEVPAAIRQEVALNNQVTFYVRWGDLIGRLMVFTAILLLLNTFVKGRLPKPE